MKSDIQIQQEIIAELDHDGNVPKGSVGVGFDNLVDFARDE